MPKKTKQYGIRIDEEHVNILQERVNFLNEEIPESKLSVGNIVSYLTNKAVVEYINMLNEKGIDHLEPLREESK